MTTHVVTVEELEQQISKLSPQDQLRLVARVSERLSGVVSSQHQDQNRARRLAEVDAWIAEADEVAKLWEGEFDSAADLRRIRDEEH